LGATPNASVDNYKQDDLLRMPPNLNPADFCVRNKPKSVYGLSAKGRCGDLIVDHALKEECDCGTPEVSSANQNKIRAQLTSEIPDVITL
jgi:hypothetical protein